MKSLLCATCATALLVLAGVSNADATCISPIARADAVKRVLPPKTANAAVSAAVSPDASFVSIVGLWFTTFYAGEGPDVWDQAYEQWHVDGTEIALDNAVPPSLGNVCLGIWKQDKNGIHLRHFAFNWNPDGTKAGTFVLLMTVKLDRSRNTFSGTYVSDSYDLDGTLIPELHAEGSVRGTRITAD